MHTDMIQLRGWYEYARQRGLITVGAKVLRTHVRQVEFKGKVLDRRKDTLRCTKREKNVDRDVGRGFYFLNEI